MELILIIMSTAAFISSTLAVALSVYNQKTLEAKLSAEISKELYSAKEDLIGVEHRLEGLMDKKLNASAAQMREVAQNDAVDLVEAVIGNQSEGVPNEGMGIASFKNIGR